MQTPPDLTDRAALDRNRARARAAGPALFLHEEAAVEVQERLVEVNRAFTDAAVVTPFPDVWAPVLPGAELLSDADLLPLSPGSCDLVVHALGLHWANDPVGQLIQCRRALRPDGMFLGFTLAGRTLHELRSALAEAEIRVSGGLSPRVAPMAEIRDLGGLLQRAGFALPVADSSPRTVSYRNVRHLMRDLRLMGEQNALADRHRRLAPRRLFEEAERIYTEAHPAAGGRVSATFEIVVLTGWAPDASQPQPLRPGSATARLADALGTKERPASGPPERRQD